MNLGKLIIAYRNQQGLSVREYAKEIGLSSATLNRIERGHPMDQARLVKLFNYLFEAKGENTK